MSMRRSIQVLSLPTLMLLALVACKKQPTEQPAGAGGDAPPSQGATAETPEDGCKRMLERFGEDVIEVELEGCVSALTDGTEISVCREEGAEVEKDYRSCFDSCMGSVDIDPAEYSPGDSSTSPVVNCVEGCFQTTCQG
jgi:hypothetical protein